MIFDLPPTTYIAQVYNCDNYGTAAYNECPVAPSTTPGSSSTSSTTRQSQTTTTDDTIVTDDTLVTTNGTQPTSPSQPKPVPNQQKEITLVTPASTIAGMDWMVIVPISLVLSVLAALVILLFKRHRRKQAY